MISVDMVAAGDQFLANSTGAAKPTMKDFMVALGAGRGLRYRQESGMSDHEAFEKAGVPSVWLEYREPACYHQASDVPSAVPAEHVTAAGALLQEFFES
jgi:hypothetical protein